MAKHDTGNRIIFTPHVNRKHVVIDRAALQVASKYTPFITVNKGKQPVAVFQEITQPSFC